MLLTWFFFHYHWNTKLQERKGKLASMNISTELRFHQLTIPDKNVSFFLTRLYFIKNWVTLLNSHYWGNIVKSILLILLVVCLVSNCFQVALNKKWSPLSSVFLSNNKILSHDIFPFHCLITLLLICMRHALLLCWWKSNAQLGAVIFICCLYVSLRFAAKHSQRRWSTTNPRNSKSTHFKSVSTSGGQMYRQ